MKKLKMKGIITNMIIPVKRRHLEYSEEPQEPIQILLQITDPNLITMDEIEQLNEAFKNMKKLKIIFPKK